MLAAILMAVLPLNVCAQPDCPREESRATTPQEASRLREIRDRFLRAAKATRELRAKAVTQEEKTLQQWGVYLDHSQRIFPEVKHVVAYEKARPSAQYYCIYRLGRALAMESSPPVISDAPALRRLLDDRDPDVRSLAIEALGSLHQPEDVGRIGKYLTDEREAVASLDWAVQLNPHDTLVFVDRFHRRIQGTRPLEPWHHIDRYWHDMKVRDYAVRSLRLMTGFVFDARSFPTWWASNKDGRNCLWYWQQRFQREWDGDFVRRLKERDVNPSVPYEKRLEALERRAAPLRARFLQETRRLSPEVEAKVLLLARRRLGSPFRDRFFDLPLSLRLEPERLLDYAERKTSWPDVDWDRPGGTGPWRPYDKPWWQKSVAASGDSLYGTMIDRLGRSADRLFKPEHVPRLQRLLEKWRSTGLMLGVSRVLRPADASNLDDPGSRDGFLRSIVRGEDDAFFRGPVAAELVRVSLADNWPFLKETVFTEPPVPLNPDVRQSIIRALAEPPLTIGKRQKLVDLLLDPRSKTMLTANDERCRCDTQQAVNAHAEEELMSDELVRRLGDAETATEAWEEFVQKIRRFGADTGDRLPEDREKNLGETPTAMGTRSIEHHSGPSWLIGREGQHTAKQEE